MAGPGLYANIHAKRKRGGKMKKKGAKGAPTAANFARAKQTARKGMKKGGFPDLSGDGKTTMKDVLIGRGVIKKGENMKKKKRVVKRGGGMAKKKRVKAMGGGMMKKRVMKRGGGSAMKKRVKMKKGGKSFPDLTGDGKVTRKDILKGRGVKLKRGGSAMKKRIKKKNK